MLKRASVAVVAGALFMGVAAPLALAQKAVQTGYADVTG
jgi:hypothetical protein